MIDYIEYLADILTVGDLEERVAVVDELMKESKIAFLRNYVARKRKEGLSGVFGAYRTFQSSSRCR